ncbi:unnamed protein product [Protopolystoma xenopodis]|uniref:Major facilitator superfamily (MFS) profile domain-containing protein n=1 Tax=Protopolystoma xenopodis TaxID=117903 RepID=A0A3S5BUU8_9PLAT|nr:unnamed protein product [Protopolystoma xenopodis]
MKKNRQQMPNTATNLADVRANPFRRLFRAAQRWISTLMRENRATLYIIPSIFITYLALVGNERVFGKFMFDYVKCGPLSFSTHEGYALNAAYWVSFCLARLIVFVITLRVSCKLVMAGLLLGTTATSLGMCLIPKDSERASRIAFFVLSTGFGLFKSPLFPTGLGVINTAVPVTGIITAFVNLGSALGAALLQFLAGALIENHGQVVFPFMVFGTACLLMFCGLSIIWMTRWIINKKSNAASSSLSLQLDACLMNESETSKEVIKSRL